MNCIKLTPSKDETMEMILRQIENLQKLKEYYEQTKDYDVVNDIIEVAEEIREKAYRSDLIDEINNAQDGNSDNEMTEEELAYYNYAQEKLENPSQSIDTSDVYRDYVNNRVDLGIMSENRTNEYIYRASGL